MFKSPAAKNCSTIPYVFSAVPVGGAVCPNTWPTEMGVGVGVGDGFVPAGVGVGVGLGTTSIELNTFALLTLKAIQLNRISFGAGLFNNIVNPLAVLCVLLKEV